MQAYAGSIYTDFTVCIKIICVKVLAFQFHLYVVFCLGSDSEVAGSSHSCIVYSSSGIILLMLDN